MADVRRKHRIALIFSLAIAGCMASRPAAGQEGRKRVATWLVYDEEKRIDRIQQNADIIGSLSIFGNPPREFIDKCRELHIELYKGVSGNADEFDTPSRSKATLEKYLSACKNDGFDGIDLDFENLDPSLQDKYSGFVSLVSSALHNAGKKLSHCVGFYPGMEMDPPKKIFYDPKTVGETCDVVRVMCYDLYWAPGRGDPKLINRPDTQGIGPTSNYPWAKAAMRFWLAKVPREKLIMGLPAYSNDYALSPKGKGQQVYASMPQISADIRSEKAWLWYERLSVYVYSERDGTPHIFYASDAESTKALLGIVDGLDLPGIGFWHFSSVDDATWKVVRAWAKAPVHEK